MLIINNVESLNVPFVYKTDSMYFEAKLQYSKTLRGAYKFDIRIENRHKYTVYLHRNQKLGNYKLALVNPNSIHIYETTIPLNELLNLNWFANFVIDYVNNK